MRKRFSSFAWVSLGGKKNEICTDLLHVSRLLKYHKNNVIVIWTVYGCIYSLDRFLHLCIRRMYHGFCGVSNCLSVCSFRQVCVPFKRRRILPFYRRCPRKYTKINNHFLQRPNAIEDTCITDAQHANILRHILWPKREKYVAMTQWVCSSSLDLTQLMHSHWWVFKNTSAVTVTIKGHG